MLKLPKVRGTERGIVDPATGATVFMFSADAAPLTLGTLRNTTSVKAGTAAFAAGEPFAAQVCACPVIGCTRMQGYWKSKPGVVGPAPYARDAQFFLSGLTWQQLFNTPPRGNAYIILAYQYIDGRAPERRGADVGAGRRASGLLRGAVVVCQRQLQHLPERRMRAAEDLGIHAGHRQQRTVARRARALRLTAECTDVKKALRPKRFFENQVRLTGPWLSSSVLRDTPAACAAAATRQLAP